jgi:Ca-activated chloride channel family protein
MSSRVVLAALLAAAGATALNAQQGNRIRSGVELVSLNVTVTDGTNKYATDLNQEDFEVFEDGAKQKLTFFSRTQQPISLAILLDTSASMDERMGIAQEAAIGFAKQLHKDDQAEVVDFDSQVRILSPFTNDAAALEKAIRATTPNGSTSLYNAIYISLKELKKTKVAAASEIRRQAIVLLSDGDDTSSLIEFDEVLDLAKRSETSIYAIGLAQGDRAARAHMGRAFVSKLASETGGRAFFPTDARELAKIYQTIWDERSPASIASRIRHPTRNAIVPGGASRCGC